MNYNYCFSCGDPYGDGHCRYEEFHITANKTVEEIDQGFKKVNEILGYNILDLCSEWGEEFLSEKIISHLNDLGIFKDTDLQESISDYLNDAPTELDYYLDSIPEDLITIVFAALKVLVYPDFEWSYRDLEEQCLYPLHGLGYELYRI